MTDKEYGALEESIDEIKYLKSLDVLSKGPVWALQWFALEFEMTNEEPRYATMPVSSDEKLVTEARKSLEAFEFAKWIAAGRIKAGVRIPPCMAKLIGDWMDGSWEPPSKTRGPSVAKNWHRDFIIRYVLDILSDRYEIQVTKNRASKTNLKKTDGEHPKRTGAEILEDALRITGLHPPSSTRIENIATQKAFIAGYDEMRGFLISADLENLEPEARI